jgi:hypothetical protein
MLAKMTVVILLLATSAGATSTLNVQLGLTQFYNETYDYYGWDWYYYGDAVNRRGYAAEVRYERAFPNWAVGLDLRTVIFPGRENSVAIYADVRAPFYFTKAPVRIYAAPGLGYNHTEKRTTGWGAPPGRSKRDYFRFPVAFGVRAVSGTKYLDIRYRIAPEVPVGDLRDYDYDEARDFYLEQSIEGEFGWAFAKHFGMTAKAGAVKGSYAITINTGDDVPPYVPFVEVGPSIYF